MLLVLLALACLATVPAAGGDLRRLADIRLRAGWAAFAAIAIQVAITTVAPGGGHALHAALHVASYVLAGAFIVADRAVPGLTVMAAGGVLNLVAIAANGGVMPASAGAAATARLATGADFANSSVLAHPRLAFLGDVIGVPGPAPFANVLSVGDLVIYAGLLSLLHRVCESRLSRRSGSAAHSAPA